MLIFLLTGAKEENASHGIKIISEHPLIVNSVLDTNVSIPWQTKQRHLYLGPNILSSEKAVSISTKWASDFDHKNVSQQNVVFEDPAQFIMCQTSQSGNPVLVISRSPVRTFQCVSSGGKWSAQHLGNFHVIFNHTAMEFVGYLYKDVIFN
jgi:hypothetical protein